MTDDSQTSVSVYNRTRETFVATEASVADTYWTRLVGLLGKRRQWAQAGRGLWILPSKGVHTIGMLFPIDLIFLDHDKFVVHVEEHVRPFSISKVFFRAKSVLELPAHTIFRTSTQVGDCLEIRPVRKPRREESLSAVNSGSEVGSIKAGTT